MHHQLPPVANAPQLVSPNNLAPFVDALPIPCVAKPVGHQIIPGSSATQAPFYQISIHEFFQKVHRDLPATRFWGYGGSVPGPTFETRSGEGVLVEWKNDLPNKHFLPIDFNLMGAGREVPEVRTVVHLHGAKAPPASDGYPEEWYVPGKSAICHYPNDQDSAQLWYHDHAMGINRLNVCAGMVGLYIIRDKFEEELNLPKGEFEVPLVLMDRLLRRDGQIYYPVSQQASAPWVPEYFGDAILVNGKLLPYLEVQPRKYRFRILNGSNGRFYSLSLLEGRPFQQIGSDLGLLSSPVEVKVLTLSPAERADVVVDFSNHIGEDLLLKDLNTTVMQFRVAKNRVKDSSALPQRLRTVSRIPESAAVRTRRLTLEQVDNLVAEPKIHLLDGKHWDDPISENPVLDTTEIWEFLNLTDDSHPIHLHLVRFQILDRRPINVEAYVYDKKLIYTADAVPPAPNELGWKDTVRVSPGSSTRIIVKFEGYAGRYVWHCHILEHEDNEMMRPYTVLNKPN
jgi:spore coat protein A, manganese oxidase